MNTMGENDKGSMKMPVTFPVHIQTMKVSGGPNQTVYYPQVIGMPNQAIESSMNHLIVQQAEQLIQQQVAEMPTPIVEMIGSYEIKNNQRHVLSLSQSNYTYHHHAAHGMTYMKSLTFDTQTGKMYQLKDLFKPGSDYIKRLSTIIRSQIKQREIPLLGEFTSIQPNQDFYIADKALVIYFQLYEITPYYVGFPMFPISVFQLQDMIDENGPLGWMAMNH